MLFPTLLSLLLGRIGEMSQPKRHSDGYAKYLAALGQRQVADIGSTYGSSASLLIVAAILFARSMLALRVVKRRGADNRGSSIPLLDEIDRSVQSGVHVRDHGTDRAGIHRPG